MDAVAGESDTSNNCSASATVTVDASAQSPDLVVATPSVSNSRPAAGASFTLSATVRNDGNGDAPATTLRFYRSTHADFRRSSIQVGTGAVAPLAASGSISGSVDLTAPSDPGTYYYGAYVDQVAGEADRTNNFSTGAVQVEVASQSPDLVVQLSAIPRRGVFTEATIALAATVRNGGADDAPATTLRFYRSTDATITTSDTVVGTDAVAALAGAATASARLAVTVPATPGTYYYGACVDAVADEADTTNNCSTAEVEVVERPLPPDLIVEHADVTPSSVSARDRFVITVRVRNRGEGDSPVSPTLRYYYSVDAAISSDDTEVGTDFIGPLAASASTDEAHFRNASSYGGTYYYGACVGTVPQETDTSNNCSSAAALTVAGPPPPQPDLMVQSPYASIVSPVPEQVFTVGVRVRNNGTADAASTTLRWRRSSDATITTSDTEVGTSAVAGLSAFSSSSESVKLTAPSNAGTYYYGACVDAVTDESDTTNNCSSSVRVKISVPPPFTSYYGAYAFTFLSDDYAVGFVVDQRSEQGALNAAQLACQADGGSVEQCSSAHSFQQCAAVVYGTDHLTEPAFTNTLSPHEAATLAAAKSDALTYCSSQWSSCTIAASGCNSASPGSSVSRQGPPVRSPPVEN